MKKLKNVSKESMRPLPRNKPLPLPGAPHRFASFFCLAALLLLVACQSSPLAPHRASPSPPTTPSFARASQPAASVPAFGRSSIPEAPRPPVSARAAIVIHANTGTVLYQKNADTRYPVASTQKLMMALILVEAGNMGKNVRVATSDTRVEPSKMGIKAGEVYRKDDLLRAVLVRSSNDIAHCLARDHAGSEAAFARLMTQRARNLGMNNSVFKTASGLPAPGQYSTARDLSILAAAAMRQPFIRQTVQTKSMDFRFANGRSKVIKNTNKVLLNYPYCTGMKTGYTRASGKCLVSSATHNGRNVIVVILGSKIPVIWKESKALLHWGLDLS